jgi:hypothetical protein
MEEEGGRRRKEEGGALVFGRQPWMQKVVLASAGFSHGGDEEGKEEKEGTRDKQWPQLRSPISL